MKKSLTRQKQMERVAEMKSDREKKPQKNQNINIRNMQCDLLPENITNILNTIVALDVSHNRLNNSEIDYIFNHGKNLKYLQIQDNLSTIIPASIWKLTNLVHFRHDWVKVFALPEQSNLKILQTVSRKPQKIVKMQSVCGINFSVYCQVVIKIPITLKLKKTIEKSDCTDFAKEQMLKIISNSSINKQVKIAQKQGNFLLANYPGCMMLLGLSESQNKHKTPTIKKPNNQDNQSSSNRSNQGKVSIKINKIKNISSSNGDITTSTGNISYFEPELPLHNVFIHFDTLDDPKKQVQQLLNSNNDPNIEDSKGLSIYHLCIVYNQCKGLQYLFELNQKNPGRLDLLTNEKKQFRNIAHYCTFLKNLKMLTILIQQGYPMDYHDSSGSRAIHLIDQNLEFLMQYRKIVKKYRSKSRKVMPIFPKRAKKESKIMVVQKRNQQLLREYQNIVGIQSTLGFKEV